MADASTRYSDDAPWKDEETLREEYVDNRKSRREISNDFGCSEGTIKHWMKKFGIETRSRKEAVREARGVPYANYQMEASGHMLWQTSLYGEPMSTKVHQLLAISEGADPQKIFGGHEVHHINGLEWDNRPENIIVLTPEEHRAISHLKHLSSESKGKVIDLAEQYLDMNNYDK